MFRFPRHDTRSGAWPKENDPLIIFVAFQRVDPRFTHGTDQLACQSRQE
ncbi:MAG: hypothetical protein VB817_09190 [Pirellulaceae bacterium]